MFWQAPSHFWGPLYFFEASSATIEGTSEKLHYSETMMEISCTIFSKNLEDLRSFSGYIFFFFVTPHCSEEICSFYRQVQPSWEIVTTTSKEATNAAWSIARRGQPAGSSSWADISHRFQPASEIYYDLCLDLWNDYRIYYCRSYCYFLVMQSLFCTPISMWRAWILCAHNCTCIRLWQSSVWNQDLVIALEPIPAYHLLFPCEMM